MLARARLSSVSFHALFVDIGSMVSPFLPSVMKMSGNFLLICSISALKGGVNELF